LPVNLAAPPVLSGLPAGVSYTYAASTGVVTLSGVPAMLANAAGLGPITVTYVQPPSGSSTVSAGITTTTADPRPANDAATVTIAGVPLADLVTTLNFPAHANAGQAVTGTVLFTNDGPSPGASLMFSLSLPAHLPVAPSLSNLPAGAAYAYDTATGVVSLTGMPATLAAAAIIGPITISYAQPASGTATIGAGVTGSTKDPNPGNNQATAAVTGSAAELLGTVYLDNNQDGLFDAGDTPLAGVTVELLSGSRVVATTTTNAAGYYSYTGVPPGAYNVALIPAAGHLAASPSPVAVSLGGAGEVTVNFGEIAAAAVGSLVLTKTTPLVNISAGQSVPYTITATNAQTKAVETVTVSDLIPAGFTYRVGSAAVNGVKRSPIVSGRTLSWTRLDFPAGTKMTFTLVLTAGAGVTGGEYTNQAMAYNGLTGSLISNVASATVRLSGDPTFDCPDLIGKVFDDTNGNGREDPGEKGIAGVRLVTAQGLLVTTDAEGRYHIACPIIPAAEVGTNFIVKVDERTLPTGYRLTTDNPETVRLTAGKVSKLNFGASIDRVVRIELGAGAFDSIALRPEVQQRIAAVLATLEGQASIVRLAYEAVDETDDLIEVRMQAAKSAIEAIWAADAEKYPLRIEEDIVRSARPDMLSPGVRP
jgi:uncharacterized repeat protein (TIGR01451 family)